MFSLTEPTTAVAEPAGAGRSTGRPVALIAMATVLPFLGLAVRLGAYRHHIFLRGDFALMDLAARQAARWHQLVGAYDRFGWRHPGPAYFYLLAGAGSVVGRGLPAQAQFVCALLLNAVSGALAVWLFAGTARRPVGAALGVAALIAGATAVLGQIVILNPWNPYVTVMPLLVLAGLTLRAVRGSGPALAGCALVGSLVIQTDLGTAPLAVLLSFCAAVGFVLGRRVRRVGEGAGAEAHASSLNVVRASGTAGLAVLTLVSWLPAVVDQASGHPGNLTLIWRFFTGNHPHVGPMGGLDLVGRVQGLLVGLHGVGWAGLVLPGALGLTALVLGLRQASFAAVGCGLLCVIGTGAAAAAAADIVGPPFAYLVTWAVVPTLTGAAGLVIVAVDGPLRGRAVVVGAIWVVALFGLIVKVVLIPPMPHYDAGEIRRAWAVVGPELPASRHQPILIDTLDPLGWAVAAGLADEVVGSGRPLRVVPGWEFQYGREYMGPARFEIRIGPPEAGSPSFGGQSVEMAPVASGG